MYLVTGATGALGLRITRQLRDRGESCRAFVRLSSHYSELEARGADICIGDLTQLRDIQRSCQNVSHLILAHGGRLGQAQAVDYRASIDLIDTAKANAVKHITFISVLGAERHYDDAPTFKAKREVEKYLRLSGVPYTILQPSGFASNLLPLAEQFQRTGLYPLIGDPTHRTSIVSTDDLAAIAIAAGQRPAAHHQTFPVGGPDILTRGDIPRILGGIFEREPLILNLPLMALDGVRTLAGWFNPQWQQDLGTLRILLADEFYCTPSQIGHLEKTFDYKLEALPHFFRRYLSI